jgi:hypothetical protein
LWSRVRAFTIRAERILSDAEEAARFFLPSQWSVKQLNPIHATFSLGMGLGPEMEAGVRAEMEQESAQESAQGVSQEVGRR